MAESKLPTFSCIGGPKCGSSWLHALLESHPDVFIPTELKELHYFDEKFDRGVKFYSEFFEGMTTEKISGDITPHYLYADPKRIFDFKSIEKLLIIYRDPVDRVVSHYKFRIRLDNYAGSLEDFLQDYPQAVEWSRYGKHLENYLRYFRRDQFLILKFEESTKDIEGTRKRLAEFLDLDLSLFPEDSGKQVVNAAFNPKNRKLYRLAIRAAKWMGDNGLYRVRNWLKNSSVTRKLLHSDGGKFDIQISEETLNKLRDQLAPDFQVFQTLIDDKSTSDSRPKLSSRPTP
jgi:hypothetical protein